MPTTVTIPDFSFTAEFYPQIRQALVAYKRQFLPELSEEAPDDPVMQFLAMLALVGHLNNCRLDFVVRELYLATARRRTSVNGLLRLIDERLAEASPAVADVLARLTRIFAVDQAVLIPARSAFSTVAGENTPAIRYETGATAQGVTRTDVLGSVLGFDSGTGLYAAWGVGAPPWPTAAENGDLILFGHADAMWDGMDVPLGVAAANILAVWEYSGTLENAPSSVAWGAGNLTFDLTTILGPLDRHGTQVTILCLPTGEIATFASTFGVSNQVVTANTLGQGAAPSVNVDDYIVSLDWVPFVPTGGNDNLDSTVDDDVAWTLPQTTTAEWEQRSVGGLTRYWLRWRVIAVAGPIEPELSAAVDPTGDFYVLAQVTQGETIDDALGNSDGTADQTFPLNRTPYIEGTLTGLDVGGDTDWVVTEEPAEFFAADPADKVAFLDVEEDGTFTVRFGDGVHGAVPPVGTAIVASYRIGADDDGNVGAGTITRNTSGVSFLADITNPRAAAGWQEPEGTTPEDLERQKRLKPAVMRAGGRAVTPDDCSVLAVETFATADGSRPVVRAWANEEEYGIKTIGLRVVGSGGAALSAAVLVELNDFFNGEGGDPNDPDRRLVANIELTSANYVGRSITGAITVTVAGSVLGVADAVDDVLTDLLDPLATQEDGAYEWEPGGGSFDGRVSPTQIAGAIWVNRASVGDVRDVEVTDVAGGGPVTLVLAANELPVKGAWVVTVVLV
ncbi:MAG: hypothetical protein ABIL09_16665 [Gemmatimonadota bacterium]